jgi:hypothetical protein
MFAVTPWLVGSVNSSLKMNAFRYGQALPDIGFWGPRLAGPIMDVQWYSEYDEKWDRLWKVNKTDIEYHIDHWEDQNYQPVEVIDNWPAHGDTEKGQAFYLAPFVDYNNDGLYNPMDGDYPEIKGDQSIFLMYNLIRPFVVYSQIVDTLNLDELLEDISKTEVHGMFYAFDSEIDSALDHTVFANIKYINRSDETYTDTYIGIFADTDIGNATDDYIGCDVMQNSIYGFNGDNEDEASTSGPGYGTNLVAQSVTILKGVKMDNDGIDNAIGIADNESVNGLNFGDGIVDNEYWGMNHFIYFHNNGAPTGGPTNALEYHNYLQSIWRDGTLMVYGGTGYDPTEESLAASFMFPGNSDPEYYGTNGTTTPEWTEITEANFPADRRGVSSSGPFTLLPGGVAEVELAFIFARDYTGSGNLAPLSLLSERINSIQTFYKNEILPLSIGEIENKSFSFISVYPNPFTDFITLDNQNRESIEIVIYNLLGKELLRKTIPAGKSKISLAQIRDNALIIKAISDDRIETKKLLRIR